MTHFIPEGWKDVRLGKLATTVTSGSRDWAQYYAESGHKFIRMTNLRRGDIHLKLDDLKFVDVQSNSADGKRTSLQYGDILISITAELGKIGWVPNDLGIAYINQHTALVRIDSGSDSKFIAYLLASRKMNHTINRLNDAGAKAGLNLSTVRSIPISLPPLAEQKKIAEILGTWDLAIENVEKQITCAKSQKKALMQQLLSARTRFPQFTDPWQTVKLGDVADISTGTSKSSYVVDDGKFLVVDMGSVSREGKLISSKKTDFNGDFLSKGQLVMPKDDIGGGNIIGRTGYIDENKMYVLSDHIYILTPKDQNSVFLNYLINSYPVNKNLRRKANGTAQLGLGKKDVEKQPLILPSFDEQKAIAQVLDAADTEITNLENQLTALKEQKKGLMQQLLTGKTRVKVDKEAA